MEVIVVDNGSTDGTRELLRQHADRVRVIKNEKNLGACRGKNQGILAASSELIAFLDSDATLLNPSTLHDFIGRFREDDRLAALGGGIYEDQEKTRPWVFGIFFTDDLYIDWERTKSSGVEAEALSTCFLMMRKNVAFEVGGFDPVFFYQHEDLDFFLHVGRLGYRCEVMPDYPVWHRISQVGRTVDRWFWMHLREEWRHQYLLIKHLGISQAIWFLARLWGDGKTMRDYYVRPIRFLKFVVLFGFLPIVMLLLSPLIVRRREMDFLD